MYSMKTMTRKSKSDWVGIRLPKPMKEQLGKLAHAQFGSVAQVVRRAIAEYLERHNGNLK